MAGSLHRFTNFAPDTPESVLLAGGIDLRHKERIGLVECMGKPCIKSRERL